MMNFKEVLIKPNDDGSYYMTIEYDDYTEYIDRAKVNLSIEDLGAEIEDEIIEFIIGE